MHICVQLHNAGITFFNPLHLSQYFRGYLPRLFAITYCYSILYFSFFSLSFSDVLGGDGRTANKRTDRGAGVAVRNVRGLHYLPSIGTYLRAHDKHVSFAQPRSHKQTSGVEARDGITARENAWFHRAGLGVLHGLGTVSVPRRGSHSLLGQVLGLFLHRRHCQHRDSHSRAHSIRRIRCSLLPFFGGLQM